MARSHPVERLEVVLLIAMGGALGANLRYVFGVAFVGLAGTFLANTAGSYVLGVLFYEELFAGIVAGRSRLVFGTGFLSSFTTYSTFALETVQATPVVGVAYVLGSYASGFLAALAGRGTASVLFGDEDAEREGGP